MKTINVGIVGCGVIAPTHAEAYAHQDNLSIQWACDLIGARAEKLASAHDIPHVTADVSDLLADDSLDAISVCTDHASHSEICRRALQAGKHVLCEKALAAKSDQLEAMIQAGRDHDDLVFAGIFQHRFNRLYQVLKDRIDEGLFGTILTAGVRMHCYRSDNYYRADQWRGTWEGEGGSVLINQAIHMIDILAWMLGGVASVSATYANRTHTDVIETEDTAVAILKMRSNALATIKATCSSHLNWNPVVSVHGTEGIIELRDGQIQLLDMRDKAAQKQLQQQLAQADQAHPDAAGKAYYGGHHRMQIADFVEAIRQNRKPFVSADSARHAVDIVLGIYHSHNTGGWVDLPI